MNDNSQRAENKEIHEIEDSPESISAVVFENKKFQDIVDPQKSLSAAKLDKSFSVDENSLKDDIKDCIRQGNPRSLEVP